MAERDRKAPSFRYDFQKLVRSVVADWPGGHVSFADSGFGVGPGVGGIHEDNHWDGHGDDSGGPAHIDNHLDQHFDHDFVGESPVEVQQLQNLVRSLETRVAHLERAIVALTGRGGR